MRTTLQQAIEYNQKQLNSNIREVFPDSRLDPDYRAQLIAELDQVTVELHKSIELWYYNFATKTLFENLSYDYTTIRMSEHFKVAAVRLGPSFWVVPIAQLSRCIKLSVLKSNHRTV